MSSSLERSPGLSSPGLLGLLVTDLEKGGPDLYSSFSVRLAELIEREGLELDEDTANTVSSTRLIEIVVEIRLVV